MGLCMGHFKKYTKASFLQMMQQLQGEDTDLLILDERIPMAKQQHFIMGAIEYMQRMQAEGAEVDQLHIRERYDKLIKADSDEEKEKAIAYLAAIGTADSLKALQEYRDVAEPTTLPILELGISYCQARLRGELTGRRQAFVISGLGGRLNKMRYCVCFFATQRATWEPYQQELLRKECQFGLCKEIELEEIEVTDRYARLTVLAPLLFEVGASMMHIRNTINEFGHFVNERFFVSNTHALSDEECLKELNSIDEEKE